ncbi:hypothetical protein ACFVYC_19190 [Pseudarthrobacter sp. NPDC058329]|uniref:hypothetical protein n=1 Tax=Pseudarthrobacter sp. NPDC058329 TaxID=3346448 RepID=UPI0036DF9F7B
METLKKIVSNQYFPAGAVLTAVVLFWAVGLLGGLSLLHNNQPPLTTLTWILFVYGAAVLTPLAGVVAALDLVRRWKRNRAAAEAGAVDALEAFEEPEAAYVEPAPGTEQATAPATTPSPAQQAAPVAPKKSAKQPGRKQAA